MLIRNILLRAILLVVPLSTVALAAQYDLDPNWPKLIQNEQGSLIVHQPRIDSLNGNDITGQAAVAVAIADEDDPIFGSVWFRAQASIDESAGSAFVDNVVIEDMAFPDEGSRELAERIITKAITGTQARVSLNQLNSSMRLAELQDRIADASSVRTDPPEIYIETVPTLLVLTEGEPRLVEEASGGLMRVVNTPFDLLLHTQTGTYYVRAGDNWFEAQTLSGVWAPSRNPPQSIASLPRRAIEQAPEGAPAIEPAAISNVIVSAVPAALIQLDGQMELSPIAGTDLLFLRNSESDVFFNISNQTYYYLFAGRWFSTKRLESLTAWRFVEPSELPGSFANIPAEIPQAEILASVPGTPEAQQAVIEATVPQTAQVDRAQASLDVTYAGNPEFAPISGTNLQYAVNTSFSVIKGNGAYYACQDGVWFVSSSPNGPWTVATYVPDEIYNIPKTHPLHNVTYVYVYDYTPRYVYSGYLPGYTGSYIYRNTVFYGTGWGYYPYYSHLYYPYYSYSNYYGYPVIPGFSLFFGILAGSYFHHHYYDHYWYDYGFNSYRYKRRAKNYLRNKRWRRGRNIYRRNVYNRWGGGRIADRSNRNRISQRLQDRRTFGRRNNQNVAAQGGRRGRNGNVRRNGDGGGRRALQNQRGNNRAFNNQTQSNRGRNNRALDGRGLTAPNLDNLTPEQRATVEQAIRNANPDGGFQNREGRNTVARGNRARNNRTLTEDGRNNRARDSRGRNARTQNNRALTEQLQNNATQNSAARNNRGRNGRVLDSRGRQDAAPTNRGRNTGSINNQGVNAPNLDNLTPRQREAAERALRDAMPNRAFQNNRSNNARGTAGQNNTARGNRGRNGRATTNRNAPDMRNLSPENRALIDQMRNRELQNSTSQNNRGRNNQALNNRSQGNRAQPNRAGGNRGQTTRSNRTNNRQRNAAPQGQLQRRAAPQRQQQREAAPQRQQRQAAPQRRQRQAAPQRQQRQAAPQRQQQRQAAPQRQQRQAAPQRQQQRQAAPPSGQSQRRAAPRRQESSSDRSERSNSGSRNSNRGRGGNRGGRGRRGR